MARWTWKVLKNSEAEAKAITHEHPKNHPRSFDDLDRHGFDDPP